MKALYYQTITQDGKSGLARFQVQPLEPCPYVTDGLAECTGTIGIYLQKMPIILSGSWENGIFHVDSCRLACRGAEEGQLLLQYVAPWLTERQKQSILSLGDVLPITSRHRDVIRKFEHGRSYELIEKLDALGEKEELTKFLFPFHVPLDRVTALINNKVTMSELLKDPYRICIHYDIGIKSADEIARSHLHIQPYAPKRLCAYVYDTLLKSLNSGNTCIPLRRLTRAVEKRMDVPMSAALVNLAVSHLNGRIMFYEDENEVYAYIRKVYMQESTLIHHIKRLQSANKKYSLKKIEEVEKTVGIHYTQSQREAFHAIESSGIKILTGPPGSGKTAIIRGIIEAFKDKVSVQLSATTGRAGQVLSEASKMPAQTTHRMLDIRPYQNNLSAKNLNNPIEADLIIVDESSMMGLELASMLVQAVKSGSILILVGDEDQLQSVEYGNVLKDLIASGKLEVYRLKEVLRHSGVISKNAEKINNGIRELTVSPDFQIFNFSSPSEALNALASNLSCGAQIVSPIKKTALGTRQINQMVQSKQQNPCVTYGGTSFYKGDSIIMTQTNYDKGYFNGDTGTLLRAAGGKVYVQIRDTEIQLDREDIRYMELAYCITIHKSQGSTYDEVHILLPDDSSHMLTKRLLYTAVTRAKSKVYIYSIRNSLQSAIENKAEYKRMTLLKQRIQKDG